MGNFFPEKLLICAEYQQKIKLHNSFFFKKKIEIKTLRHLKSNWLRFLHMEHEVGQNKVLKRNQIFLYQRFFTPLPSTKFSETTLFISRFFQIFSTLPPYLMRPGHLKIKTVHLLNCSKKKQKKTKKLQNCRKQPLCLAGMPFADTNCRLRQNTTSIIRKLKIKYIRVKIS